MSVFNRSTDGFEQAEPNRREVLLAAGGLAAATAIAGNSGGGHVADKKRPAKPHLTVAIADTRITATFDAVAFSWGGSATTSITGGGGGGASAGRPVLQDLSLTKYVDANSPKLFLTLVTGRHLQTVTLTWIGATGAPTVKITLEDVLVTSLSEGGSADEQRLTENLSLNFRTIEFAYDGVHAGYDVATTRIF